LNEFSDGKEGSMMNLIKTDSQKVPELPQKKFNFSLLKTGNVNKILSQSSEFGFPIFAFFNVSNGRPLTLLSHHLIVESGLLGRLRLSTEKFMLFLDVVESSYDSSLSCILYYFNH
jgi:hypothetical protein